MPSGSAPPFLTRLLTLTTPTQHSIQLLDITDAVQALVRENGLQDGIVAVFSRHTTAAVRIQEDEPLLIEDLCRFLAGLAPAADAYRHNDFDTRTQHMHPDERPNGHAHCLQLLLGSSESVPVTGGELQLGEWQRLFLIELDGPRPARDVLVHLLGEARPAVATWPIPIVRNAARPVFAAIGA